MRPTLLIAVIVLAVWIYLTFVMAPQPGYIHLLLGLGTALLVRWWALRA
jgi:hypothetical protein